MFIISGVYWLNNVRLIMLHISGFFRISRTLLDMKKFEIIIVHFVHAVAFFSTLID